MPSHDGELSFELIDASLRAFACCLGEVSVYDVPFAPLDPAAGFEHAENVTEEWSWFVFFDHADEMADVDHVVLFDQFLGYIGQNVDKAKVDVLR